MKNSPFILSALAIAMTLSVGQVSFAQTGNDGSTSNGTTTTVRTEEHDNGPDLGWLGLLGLAGLAGLLKKPERQVVHDTTVRTQNPPNIQNR